jgi:hypothetical protein
MKPHCYEPARFDSVDKFTSHSPPTESRFERVHKPDVTKCTKKYERILILRSISAAPTESNLSKLYKQFVTHCYHVKLNG